MPVRTYNLALDQGSTFRATWVWIGGGSGVDPRLAVSTVTFRQVPTDNALLVVSSSAPTTNGSQVTYLTPVPNYPYIPPDLPDVAPVLITLYPMQLFIAKLDMALLIYPSCNWRWDLLWQNGDDTQVIGGGVEVKNV